jgi:hypothetical protein
VNCPICGEELRLDICNRKNNKKGVMLTCSNDGRHYRAFINEPSVVAGVNSNLSLEEAIRLCEKKNK